MENFESLFSFEFVVKSVSSLQVDCTAPAVGFRLLDYPTIMIYYTDQEMVEKLRFLASNSVERPFNDKTVAGKQEIRPNFKEKDGSFSFQKGKSTLFSMKRQKLFNLLSSIPLYIVLVDVYMEKSTRIVGSCTVPLQSIIDEIKEKNCHGIHAATFSKRSINLHLFNLMGAKIGQLKGTITLYCYGDSLNKHLQTDRNLEEKGVNIYLEKQGSMIDARKNGSDLEKCSNIESHTIMKKIERVNKSTEIDHMIDYDAHLHDDEYKQSPSTLEKGEVSSKENVDILSIDDTGRKVIHNFDECDEGMGTCCPPPLFYCSENIDPFPVKRDFKQSLFNPDCDDVYKIEKVDLRSRERDSILKDKKLLSNSRPCNRVQLPSHIQSESEVKNEETLEPKKTESIREYLPSDVNSEAGKDLSTILNSLDGMPLLQGLFKEIIGLSKREKVLKAKAAKENSDLEVSKVKEEYNQKPPVDKEETEEKEGKLWIEKKKVKTQKSKKLQFKSTKSHRLRCAVNSNKKGDRSQYQNVAPESNAKKELNYFRSRTATEDIASLNDVKMATKELDDSSIHVVNKSITDTVSNNVDQASMKSRSPVSLEIYMPSITGSKANSDSSNNHIESEHVFDVDDVRHSEMNWPKPLDKKWSGLDDLSRMKESTDLIQSEEDNFAPRESPGMALVKENKPTPNLSSKRPLSSKHSDDFHSLSDSGSHRNVAETSHYSVNSPSSGKSRNLVSSSTRSWQSRSSSKSSSQEKPNSHALPQRSLNSSRSSLQSQSNRSTPRRNNSDTSKPIVSTHSPTTSKSLRTKPRNTYVSNDEITHSVDLSSDQGTDSREEDSLPKDDVKDGVEPFQEIEDNYNDQYSDDFVSTNPANSQGSSALEEHRSPTPKHIILSQAKLGYTM